MKKISIIVPVYNVEKYIEECIESIIKQTYSNIEILLINDGSTDNSGAICKKYSLQDKRIKTFEKKNGGLSDARNYGVKFATGEYIVFVDSDDVIAKETIEILYNCVNNYDADIGIVDPVHFYNNDEPKYYISSKNIVFNSDEAICTMLYQKKFLVSAWGKIYKKEIIEKNAFPVGMIFEDIAIMYKVFDKCKKVVYNNSKVYGYRHREESITTKKFSKNDFDILTICDEMNKYFKNSNKSIKKAVECYTLNAFFRIFLNCNQTHTFNKEKEKSEKYIKTNSIKCLLNCKVRKKLKIAIILFYFNKKLLFKLYTKIDRWK